MGIMKTVADIFKASPKNKTVDRYNILAPLLATGEYVSSITELVKLCKDGPAAAYLKGTTKPSNIHVQNSVQAYKDYVKALPASEQSAEKIRPFSSILMSLDSITGNVAQIEDNYQPMFGEISETSPEKTLRSSSLVIIGYLEQTDAYVTWLSNLVEHMTADDSTTIAPFRTKELLSKAHDAGMFAAFNLHKWNSKAGGLLSEIKEMQKKGSDLVIQSADGSWIDDYAHDNQFSTVEQSLISSSFRSPIMMMVTNNIVRTQDKLALLGNRKDWLTSKIILEQSKLRGMDPESAEYKHIKKATERYSDLVSKYEQRIERLRA